MLRALQIVSFFCLTFWLAENVAADEINFSDKTEKESKFSSKKIRVGLFTGIPTVYTLRAKDTLQIEARGDKLRIIDKGKIRTVSKVIFPEGPLFSVSQTKSFKNHYAGELSITAQHSKLTVINTLDTEEYLRGVVPYEIGKLDSSRYEALKAQTVAARTYAYRHFESRASLGFDVFADTRDQVYNGRPQNAELSDRAILETAGEILTYENKPIEAYYHSTCGGFTASTAVWGKEPISYLISRADTNELGKPFCSESSYSHWERQFSAKTLFALFRKNLSSAGVKNAPAFKKIRSIVVESTFEGGRIMLLSILTDKGSFSVLGDKVRWLFAENGKILPSSNFTLTLKDEKWILEGSGFGHGIGLCQMGARARAQNGESYREILNFYYPFTTLEKALP